MANWSSYQEAIFAWNRQRHLMVKAGAGCGKTTTIVELYKRILAAEPSASILFMAFNKKIVEELANKGVPASTMNGFGHKCIRGARLDADKVRNICKYFNVDYKYRNMVGRLVDLLKSYLHPREVGVDVIRQLAVDFDLIDDKTPPSIFEVVGNVFRQSLNDIKTFDFTDQIVFPVYHNLPVPKYDYVIIDEAQDLSPAKLELVSRAVGRRFICVGDPQQAIYGFCGADSESMDKIITHFEPVVMSLPVTYRCGKKIVEAARPFAPVDFQAGPSNHEGTVKTVNSSVFEKEVHPLDFVLCRMSAPLVTNCFRLIKKGIRATVLGRDIGKKLVDLVDKIHATAIKIETNGPEMEQFCCKYQQYRSREVAKLEAAEKEQQAQKLEDQLSCIFVFVEGANSIEDIKGKIASIFDDNVNPSSVIFSTIHKAKGLEAERVWCLSHKGRPAKRDKQKQEEKNLQYVMITRAKNELFFVEG